MQEIAFTKMHGLGNDFVVINAFNTTYDLSKSLIQRLADRRFGIGCDQVLVVEKPRGPEAMFQYRIFNADGSEVEQCGNGARCFAKFVVDQGLTEAHEIPVETNAGLIILKINADLSVSVNMGAPDFTPAALPFTVDSESTHYPIEVNGESLQIGAVSMGNPHAILPVDDIETAPVAWLGPLLERHEAFPKRVNVGFMQILDREHIKLRVFERGTGETKACGTGACAAVAYGISAGWLDHTVQVTLPGGELTISWAGGDQALIMTGPAERVFEGSIKI